MIVIRRVDVHRSHGHAAQQRRDIHGGTDSAERKQQRKGDNQPVIGGSLFLKQQLHKQSPKAAQRKYTQILDQWKKDTGNPRGCACGCRYGDGDGDAVCQQRNNVIVGYYLQKRIHKITLGAGLAYGHHCGGGRCGGCKGRQNDGK